MEAVDFCSFDHSDDGKPGFFSEGKTSSTRKG
jgi:hypothetical protein